MGIKFEGVPPEATRNDVAFSIARLVHHPPFPRDPSGLALNFDVKLLMSSNPTNRTTGRAGSFQAHRGSGFLTFPHPRLDSIFLDQVALQADTIIVYGSRLRWSKAQMRDDVNLVADVQTTPWKDPVELEKVEKESRILSSPVEISGFAFGRLLRDGTFSIEEQRQNVLRPELLFDGKRRTIALVSHDANATVVRIPINSVSRIVADQTTLPASIVLSLSYPPSFEQYSQTESKPLKLSSYDTGHARIAPFGCDLRFQLPSASHVQAFLTKSQKLSVAGTRVVHAKVNIQQQVLRYTPENLDKLEDWFESIDITLAFQLALLLHNSLLDPSEILQLKKWTDDWVRRRLGVEGTAEVLRRFAARAEELNDGEDEHGEVVKRKTIAGLIGPIKEEVLAERLGGKEPAKLDLGLFSCFHLVQTPTSLFLSGPHGASLPFFSSPLSLSLNLTLALSNSRAK